MNHRWSYRVQIRNHQQKLLENINNLMVVDTTNCHPACQVLALNVGHHQAQRQAIPDPLNVMTNVLRNCGMIEPEEQRISLVPTGIDENHYGPPANLALHRLRALSAGTV